MTAPAGLIRRKMRNGLPGVRVTKATLLSDANAATSQWALELACGHRIERIRRYVGAHHAPRWAGCRECAPNMPQDLP